MASAPTASLSDAVEAILHMPLWLSVVLFLTANLVLAVVLYFALLWFAPTPREPSKAEKTYITIDADGETTQPQRLPCWYDKWRIQQRKNLDEGKSTAVVDIEPAEVFLSLVVPAYNEEKRLTKMLDDAVELLEWQTPTVLAPKESEIPLFTPATQRQYQASANGTSKHTTAAPLPRPWGYEILIVSDGSTDGTMDTALAFARKLQTQMKKRLAPHQTPLPSPIRIVSLQQNRGKGGAVRHGLQHARGLFVLFADADGATNFNDTPRLIHAARLRSAMDPLRRGRALVAGSRAHLVGSAAVVQRSILRNALMHSFHLLLRLLTPPATSRIRDTQCGFKLFSRAALADIVPYMHSEGWIFDVELLMLAESAAVPVMEVPVQWTEITGSKLNVMWDSVGMAFGLALLRVAWALGVYSRKTV